MITYAQIHNIVESLSCLWVIKEHETLLDDTIYKLDRILEDESIDINLKLTNILNAVKLLKIHPDEEGEWINLKSLVIKDIDKLIEDGI